MPLEVWRPVQVLFVLYFPSFMKCHILTQLGARFDDGAGGDNEVQRTMLELINQLDGFDPRGNIKVLMATNRPDTLDPALMRPGRLDRKIEFSLPDLEVNLTSPAKSKWDGSLNVFCLFGASGPHTHLQDSRALHERGEGHSL